MNHLFIVDILSKHRLPRPGSPNAIGKIMLPTPKVQIQGQPKPSSTQRARGLFAGLMVGMAMLLPVGGMLQAGVKKEGKDIPALALPSGPPIARMAKVVQQGLLAGQQATLYALGGDLSGRARPWATAALDREGLGLAEVFALGRRLQVSNDLLLVEVHQLQQHFTPALSFAGSAEGQAVIETFSAIHLEMDQAIEKLTEFLERCPSEPGPGEQELLVADVLGLLRQARTAFQNSFALMP